ncbi:MAG: sulfate permease [Clostridiales bacterium GWF2_36_10]|nr:MAG: sulfate permease [Clostridiales bacterium GWF2_36_10]HAN21263.1 SulP family inorganic anion transporter [Clostridiales bacterium]
MLKNFMRMLCNEFKGYNSASFGKDLLAGITVAAVALPLALAFGVSSGATAAAGLITAIIAGLVIGALSGSSFQISGPTGAMSAILISIVAKFGLQGVFVACFISGVILILAGILKLGNLVSIIPAPVITGFTSGIAVIIVIGQIDNLSGMTAEGEGAIAKIISYFTHPQNFNLTALLIGASVILFMLLYPKKWSKYCPSSLLAIILVTGASTLLKFNAAVVGDIPKSLLLSDRLSLSSLDYGTIQSVFIPAVSIAALGLIESLLCGASAGRMKNEKLDAGIELTAQGIGNMLLPFFGGVPATAAIARTSVAIKSGGKTRLTSIIHAIILLLSMFVLAPIMSKIPLSALAGVLIVTAWRMNEWESIKNIFAKRFYTAILQFFITMIATVVFDLTIAIVIGVIFSAILFIVHVSDMQISIADVDKTKLSCKDCVHHDNTCVVYITGPLYFGTANKLSDNLYFAAHKDIIIFSMRGVPFTDLSGADSLHNMIGQLKNSGAQIYFAGVQPKVMEMFRRCGISETVGEDSFFWSADLALNEIERRAL